MQRDPESLDLHITYHVINSTKLQGMEEQFQKCAVLARSRIARTVNSMAHWLASAQHLVVSRVVSSSCTVLLIDDRSQSVPELLGG